MTLDAKTLAELIRRVSTDMTEMAGEVRALDAAMGDGDLGLTLTLGARAIQATVAELEDVEPATLLSSCARAVATANPSTMAALVGAGLAAAGASLRGRLVLSGGECVVAARAAYESMRRLGKSEPGQKTILDSMGPSVDALERLLATTSH